MPMCLCGWNNRLEQTVPKMEHLALCWIFGVKLFGVRSFTCVTIMLVIGCGTSHAPEKSGPKQWQ
jgi:hypothetical protein